MVSIAPINHIEIMDENGEQKARIAGTRITVGEIAYMHLYGDSSVDWIVENFDALNHSQVYAALSFYFDHRTEIDTQMREDAAFVQQHAHTTLSELIEKARTMLD